MLRPVANAFLFAFLSDTVEGKFVPKNKGKIILLHHDPDKQGEYARWAKVLAIGNDVTEFKRGDVVLVDKLKWTKGFTHDGIQVWKSDQDQVLAIGDDESVAYDYAYDYTS
jgi:hypothetical protein